jgi:hypothetical protein
MKPRTVTLPEGSFVALIAAINRGSENEMVDEAARLARRAIAERPNKQRRSPAQKVQSK